MSEYSASEDLEAGSGVRRADSRRSSTCLDDLPAVTENCVPRCLYPHPGYPQTSEVEDIKLHGFSDASMQPMEEWFS